MRRHAAEPATAPRRYAGRAFEKEGDLGGPGALMVKGLKSMWRQAAPVVRRTLHGCLQRILMQARICRGARLRL